MTRFWITLDQGVDFVIADARGDARRRAVRPEDPEHAHRRPRARASRPTRRLEVVGIRPGEKLHEQMISVDDARRTLDAGAFYVIQPDADWWDGGAWAEATPCRKASATRATRTTLADRGAAPGDGAMAERSCRMGGRRSTDDDIAGGRRGPDARTSSRPDPRSRHSRPIWPQRPERARRRPQLRYLGAARGLCGDRAWVPATRSSRRR